MKKTISELDTNKIEERHLVTLSIGDSFLRRTANNDPLTLYCGKTTFTTHTPLEEIGHRSVHRPTANINAAFGIETIYKETEDYKGDCKIFKLKVIKKLDRILDLDVLCKEQGIEDIYLKPDGTYFDSNEELIAERPIHNLYDINIGGKKLNGVKHRSRQHPEGQCIVFYDNIHFISPVQNFLVYKLKLILSQFLRLNLNPRHRAFVGKFVLSLSARVLYDYLSYDDITDQIVKYNDKQGEEYWRSHIPFI